MGAPKERDDALTIEGWPPRFRDAATERSYVRWRFERSYAARRAYTFVAAGFWSGLIALMLAFELVTPAALSAGVMYPLLAINHVALRSRNMPRAVAFNLVTFAASGLLGTYIGLEHLGPSLHGALLAGVVLACYFQLGGAHEHVGAAAAAVAIYVVAFLAALAVMFRSGRLELAPFMFECFVLSVAYVMAVLMTSVADATRRDAYRQERVIEGQRATIERQQTLLEKELSHQVAERSRELGNVLAKSDATLDVRALRAGERFAERYKIVRALGAGGMGAVYEVERVTDGAKLALKAVTGEVSGAMAARFAREAEIGARVRHPNLISIVDVGVASGTPFLAMELVRGGSLEAQRSKFGDVAWALPILRQIAEGLGALHDAGVVHRDLKPANVLLADGGVAKISDFGISRFGSIDDASADPDAATMAATPKRSADLTGTNMVMGTPLYMAPEGAKSARALDASADVFAFGIIAHEMLTGHAPFSVPAFVLAMAEQSIQSPPPIDDAQLPPGMRVTLRECLSADPSKRPRVRSLLGTLSPA